MTTADTDSNRQKSKRGYENLDRVKDLLLQYKENGYLAAVQSPLRMGYPDVGNHRQFYAPFAIQFPNKTRWIIYSTTSLKQDRIKSPQWDASNLKALDSSIEKAFLIYSEDCANPEAFRAQDAKYQTGYEISAIDRILSFGEFFHEIQKEFLAGLKAEIEIEDNALVESDEMAPEDFIAYGKKWDIDGKNFELKIAQILSSESYLAQWKLGVRPTSDNLGFSFFCTMVGRFGLDSAKVLTIKATTEKTEIGYLPSGGLPKTDVLARVTLIDGTQHTITLSCKRSTQKQVSVHQYPADTYARVLASDNDKLRSLLRIFQICGNVRDMPQGTEAELAIEIGKYKKKLVLWAIGGIGGEGEPGRHWAQFLVTYQSVTKKFSVHSVEDYWKCVADRKATFGTPFSWTYASKQRGKCIQLKAPIID